MEKNQGVILNTDGKPAAEFHVTVRVEGNSWSGVMVPKIPLDSAIALRVGGTYPLRLDDGRWGNIIIGEDEMVFQSGSAPSKRIRFTGNGPLFPPTATEKG